MQSLKEIRERKLGIQCYCSTKRRLEGKRKSGSRVCKIPVQDTSGGNDSDSDFWSRLQSCNTMPVAFATNGMLNFSTLSSLSTSFSQCFVMGKMCASKSTPVRLYARQLR